MRARKLWLCLAGTVVALAGATPASASTTIGSNLTSSPTNAVQTSGTYANNSLPASLTASGGLVAPAAGVVTSWAVRTLGASSSNATIRLLVIAGNTGVAKGPILSPPPGAGVTGYEARLPIPAGGRVGLDITASDGNDASLSVPIARKSSGSGASINFWNPVLAAGETRSPSPNPPLFSTDTDLSLQATMEPDADGDGWGDESQDDCAGIAGDLHGCPPGTSPTTPTTPTTPTLVRPDTTITSGPTKTKKPKATFAFTSDGAGATFECALDEGGFLPCSSPATVKHLTRGSHTFLVRAISADGLVDASPATQAFKVKRKPKHK